MIKERKNRDGGQNEDIELKFKDSKIELLKFKK